MEEQFSVPDSVINPIQCPYLGTHKDPAVFVATPSRSNFCYKSDPGATPSASLQKKICLSPVYKECPIYVKPGKGRIPEDLRWKSALALNSSLAWITIPILLSGFLILFVVLGVKANWWRSIPVTGIVSMTASPSSSPVLTSTFDGSGPISGLPPMQLPVNPSATDTSTPTPTPTPTRASFLFWLFGPTRTPSPPAGGGIPVGNSLTPSFTITPTRTATPTPTPSRTSTATLASTLTPTLTFTPVPTWTSSPIPPTVTTVVSSPSLGLSKTANTSSYTNVGDSIGYKYVITNNGNTTLLAPFSVIDDKVSNVSCGGKPSLAPGAKINCTGTYSVTQADIDATFVTNIAYATTNGLNSNTVSVTVNYVPPPTPTPTTPPAPTAIVTAPPIQ